MAAVWLQDKVCERGHWLRPRLYAGCVTRRRCSCSLRLVTLYKCYAFAFAFFLFNYKIVLEEHREKCRQDSRTCRKSSSSVRHLRSSTCLAPDSSASRVRRMLSTSILIACIRCSSRMRSSSSDRKRSISLSVSESSSDSSWSTVLSWIQRGTNVWTVLFENTKSVCSKVFVLSVKLHVRD